MQRLLFLLAIPLLVAFAPVPVLKPMNDPDRGIQQFASDVVQRPESSIPTRKRRLLNQLEELHVNLLKGGKPTEAEHVRERLLLAQSIDVDKPLGDLAPTELLKRASLEGKYRHLQHVLYVPNDRTPYSYFNDFGQWPGTSYLGNTDLKPGHWVYFHPRWYIWRDGPPKP